MPSPEQIVAAFKARHASPKKKRKPCKQQVKEAKERLLTDLRSAMIDKKRSIPKEWERGFMSAMSVVEQYDLEK